MKIAVIGSGNVGGTLGKGWAKKGHDVTFGVRNTSDPKLKERLAKTIDYVKSYKPAQFEGADLRDVTFPVGPSNTMTLKGQQFLTGFAFPNFYFHAAIAHGILRHNGVEIGKRDFLGVN